ncbi:TetR/AcrR family transcriptional regulator [Sneathiella glossodoripedis]|uniref:TetR/AcrR family transcriptional regulator n=1 Tax=Sneathiella glossodoripedis TaxID=418853 RepID=UPI000472D501|nr:TetR/AcrR family transcriptional regulator [Sneathiella glossodoripedis]
MAAGVPQRRTQQQRREETRAKLIDSAFEIIKNKGAASFTTAEVAELAGLTRGAIQYHFANPYELLREVVIKVVNAMIEQVEAADLLKMERKERLAKIVDIYWDGYRSDTYVVFIELTLHGRLIPELSGNIRDAIALLETERDDQWLTLMCDFECSDREKISWRASLLTVLRGLALKQMFAGTQEDVERLYQDIKHHFIQSIYVRAGLVEVISKSN